MTTIREIEDRVDALSERVRRLHSGDWVAISYHSGAWFVRCHYGPVNGSDACVGPAEALDKFERNLAHVEGLSNEHTLARTLGVVAA